MHRWAKRETEAPEARVEQGGIHAAAAADIVEQEYKAWAEILDKFKDWQAAPWREEEGRRKCGRSSALPDINAGQLRKAAATFTERTDWGVGNLGPRHFMWLSDELLNTVARLFMAIEDAGLWPQQLLEALIHLIPKPTGGRRPIGLLAALPKGHGTE